MATYNPVAKTVLSDIRYEEKAYVGKLMELLRHLDPKKAEHLKQAKHPKNLAVSQLRLTDK